MIKTKTEFNKAMFDLCIIFTTATATVAVAIFTGIIVSISTFSRFFPTMPASMFVTGITTR